MSRRALAALAPALCAAVAAAAFLNPQKPRAIPEDLDLDGLADSLEQDLAERYAPIVLHQPDEPNLPVDAASYLENSDLRYFEESCSPTSRLIAPPAAIIPAFDAPACSSSPVHVSSYGSFSIEKKHTFYLSPRDPKLFSGSTDTRRWITYFHVYPSRNGVTVQYWRFFAYNTSYFHGFHALVGNHQGDWEAIHVVLGPPPAYAPQSMRLLGHTSIETVPWTAVFKRGSRPVIQSGKGGHTSLLASERDFDAGRAIAQETWTGGSVRWPASGPQPARISQAGPLLNLGEKTAPRKGMEFLGYSGLWGKRETGWFGKYDSGYWGPAFNETGRQNDGFVTAWCEGILEPSKNVKGVRECYPSSMVP